MCQVLPIVIKMSASINPNEVIVKLKLTKKFHGQIEQLAKYLYDFSRKQIDPATGKINPVLQTPTVEAFIAFTTTNYFNLLSQTLKAEYARKQQEMLAQQQAKAQAGG